MPYSQKKIVIEHLRRYGSIDQKTCWNLYGISRLSAHIEVLRNDDGLNISGEFHHNEVTHWKVYRLEEVIFKTEENGQYSLV